MDPKDLRAGLAEALQSTDQLSAGTLNLACFWLSRELESLEFTVPAAGPAARALLRAAGRILIDTATPEADPATWANTEEMVLVWLDQMLGELGYQVTPTPAGGRSPLPAREAGWH